MIEHPSLGLPVRFTWTLSRRTTGDGRSGFRKVWVTERWPGEKEPKSRRGLIIGVRTLSNGGVEYGDYDTPTTYEAEERFRAYLVAYDLNRKPVLVLPEHACPVNPHERYGEDQVAPEFEQALAGRH